MDLPLSQPVPGLEHLQLCGGVHAEVFALRLGGGALGVPNTEVEKKQSHPWVPHSIISYV